MATAAASLGLVRPSPLHLSVDGAGLLTLYNPSTHPLEYAVRVNCRDVRVSAPKGTMRPAASLSIKVRLAEAANLHQQQPQILVDFRHGRESSRTKVPLTLNGAHSGGNGGGGDGHYSGGHLPPGSGDGSDSLGGRSPSSQSVPLRGTPDKPFQPELAAPPTTPDTGHDPAASGNILSRMILQSLPLVVGVLSLWLLAGKEINVEQLQQKQDAAPAGGSNLWWTPTSAELPVENKVVVAFLLGMVTMYLQMVVSR